jgi:Amt family ammonium transporter
MFCATTASIVSGTLAERIKLWPFLIFVLILTALIYPIQASWKWGGGFLDSQFGFLDFAGSTVVHSVGGWAALTGAIILGARKGKYGDGGEIHPMPGSSMPLATLGTFILWLGWFGFNGGSQLALGSVGDAADVSRIFSNTNTAAAGGALAALILTQMVYKKVDLTMVLNGALAGLVSITAEPLTPTLGHGHADRCHRWRDRGVHGADARQAEDRRRGRRHPGPPVRRYLGHAGGGLLTNGDATIGRPDRPIIIVGAFVVVSSSSGHPQGHHGHPGLRGRRDAGPRRRRARRRSLPRVRRRQGLG